MPIELEKAKLSGEWFKKNLPGRRSLKGESGKLPGK